MLYANYIHMLCSLLNVRVEATNMNEDSSGTFDRVGIFTTESYDYLLQRVQQKTTNT